VRLSVRPEAERDAAYHWHYLAPHNLDAADRFLRALEDTYEKIRQQPGIGHQEGFRRQKGIRSWRVKRFPRYLVFYRVSEDQIEVLRVLYGMRNLPRFFG
jgi:toxin ParE1/3/4